MTRKLFGTDGIRGKANIYPMTPEIALKVGKAVACTIKDNKDPKIVIGKDTRLSGYMIETALASGIISMGVDVYLVGPMPTPAVALLTKSLNAHAGIVITASHNPYEDNGIKIFDGDGFKLPDDAEKKIEDIMESDKDDKHKEKNGHTIGKAYRLNDAKGRYIEFAKSTIKDFNLSGLKIVLDCANGAAYYVAPRIFSELGAEVIVLNDKPNGLNINMGCGATHPEVAAEKVKKEKADVGITLDGDADRLIVCDENGEVIDGDFILSFCALEMKKKGKLSNDTLVVTDYSNLGVDEALKKEGIKVIRTENGDRYVIEAMRYGDYNIGGEVTGHMIFSDYVTTGDGIISALQFLRHIKENKIKVSDVNKILNKYPQITLSFNVKEKKPFGEMPEVSKNIDKVNSKLKNKGRSLIRYSGTQNMCRIMIEGKDEKEITEMANAIADSIKKEVGA